MGTRTTATDVATLWPELVPHEQIAFRLRVLADSMVLDVVEVSSDQHGVAVRGYQLNGALAETQRDPKSQAARIRMLQPRTAVEILDLDEPIDVAVEPDPVISVPDDFDVVGVEGNEVPLVVRGPPSAVDAIRVVQRLQAHSVPVSEWKMTSLKLPPDVLERANQTAKERMIGRNMMLATMIEQALGRLEDLSD